MLRRHLPDTYASCLIVKSRYLVMIKKNPLPLPSSPTAWAFHNNNILRPSLPTSTRADTVTSLRCASSAA